MYCCRRVLDAVWGRESTEELKLQGGDQECPATSLRCSLRMWTIPTRSAFTIEVNINQCCYIGGYSQHWHFSRHLKTLKSQMYISFKVLRVSQIWWSEPCLLMKRTSMAHSRKFCINSTLGRFVFPNSHFKIKLQAKGYQIFPRKNLLKVN